MNTPQKPCPAAFFNFSHENVTGGLVPNLLSAYALCEKRMWKWMEGDAGFLGYCLDATESVPAGSTLEQGQRVIFRGACKAE